MRGRKTSTLIPQNHLKTATFSVKIPSDVIARHEKIKADAASLGYVFDTQSIVSSALIQALNHAEQELERMLAGKPGKEGN